MKKMISGFLVLLMVATPCFAQEIGTDGIISLNGTRWNICQLGLFFSFFPIGLPDIWASCEHGLAFYQGKVYSCDDPTSPDNCILFGVGDAFHFFYIDLGVVSIVFGISLFGFSLAILQPIGLGYSISVGLGGGSFELGVSYQIGLMYKVNDNWSPLETE